MGRTEGWASSGHAVRLGGTRVPARWCDGFRHRPGPQAVARVVGMEPVGREVAAGMVAERRPGSTRYVDVGRTWGPGREMTDVVVEGPAPPAGDGPQGLRKPGRRTHVGDAQQHQPGPRGQAGEHLSVVA